MPNTHAASRAQRFARYQFLFGLLIVIAASACSRLHRGDDDIATGPSYLVFVNQSLEQADVFVVGPAGDATRIGTVQPGRTETLTVPEPIAGRGPVNIVARLLTRMALQSGPVTLNPGDRMQATISVDGRSLTLLPAS